MKKSYFRPQIRKILPLTTVPTLNSGSGVNVEVDPTPFDGEFDGKKATWE